MENEKSNQTEKKTAGSCPSAMTGYLFICFFVFLFSVFYAFIFFMPFYIFLFLQQANKTFTNNQSIIINHFLEITCGTELGSALLLSAMLSRSLSWQFCSPINKMSNHVRFLPTSSY